MPGHDIIVMGASAGGVEPLKKLVHALPKGLPASVFIVLHTGPDSPGYLASILGSNGNLIARYPTDGTVFRKGHVYIAPPDQHMLLNGNRIRIVRGPKENRARPAIDPLFRSAAWSYGPRVIGIVLSGMLDDGVAGLRAVKSTGGISIVQNPEEAIFPDMPLNAMKFVEIDHNLRIDQMAWMLPKLVKQPAKRKRRSGPPKHLKLESDFVMMKRSFNAMKEFGTPAVFSCPSCGGSMWELRDGELVRYRCHVGHAFSPESLVEEQSDAIEDALYVALKGIEEKAAALRRMAQQFGDRRPAEKRAYEEKAKKTDKIVVFIRELIAKKEI